MAAMNKPLADSVAVDSGQGLVVGLQVAGIGARSYAFLIDWHIRVLLAAAWLLLCLAANWLAKRFALPVPNDGTAALIVAAPTAILYLLYHPLLEMLMQGSSPGKRMAGIRVVAQDGHSAPASAHLLRNLFRLIDCMPMFYCVGVVSCLVTQRQVRLGDLAVGTVLVYVAHDGRELRLAIGRHAHGGGRDPELLRLGADVLARWKELDEPRRRDLAGNLLTRLGEPTSAELDVAQLHARLVTALSVPEQV